MAYVVPDWHYRPEETEADREPHPEARQVSQWGRLWDLAYSREASREASQETTETDPTFNIRGWNDSVTGAPIGAGHMHEWVDTTAERILSLKPDRVLEIGCGTGLLLFRIAPHCSHYCGSDIAPNALRYIEEHRAHFAGDWPSIRLREGAADDFHDLAPGTFDTVIINSVVQLFPAIGYLVDVLEKAVEMAAPRGTVFVGDIRNRALQEAFHAAIQWRLAPDTLSGNECWRRVEKAMAMEEQLVIEPAFFPALKRYLPAIGHVEIQLRRGFAPTEMNRFRFDAILHVGERMGKESAPSGETPRRYIWWDGRPDRAWVREQLTEGGPEALRIERIPNARLAEEMRLPTLLRSEGRSKTVGELRAILRSRLCDAEKGVEPEDWWHLAEGTPYTAYIDWSSEPGCYDVKFCKGRQLPAEFPEAREDAPAGRPPTWTDYANNPLQGQIASRLELALRRYLKEYLPDYMLPSAFVLLDEMPLTPNGKVDRNRLPAPARTRPHLATALVEPRSETERRVAAIWRQVLQLDVVGVLDNFFDLGGNSLLLTRAHGRLEEEFGRAISMVVLFEYPTIQALAHHLAEPPDDTKAGVAQAGIEQSRVERTTGEQTEVEQSEPPVQVRSIETQNTEIAIIGLACRFPGADTPARFWQNLRDGVESIRFFSDGELEGVAPELLADPGYVKACAVLLDVDRFDAAFFGYSAREAQMLDPQQRLFLECAWEALERSGYDPALFPGTIGVYAGSGMNTYLLNNIHPNQAGGFDTLLGSARDLQIRLANSADSLTSRVCYKLGLTGPGVTVQTACSTSLVAVHAACRALRGGECDMALAGGVGITVPQKTGYLYQEEMILSPDGHCRAFDADAQGTVFGNGCGVVVLKSLDRALAAGDEIHAVIKGSAVNNDGSMKVGYTAPGVEGQTRVIQAALADAGVDPRTVSYLEAHGTGTMLGDPVEVTALTRAFRHYTPDKGFCALGSVKTNVGHLIEAAGVCGLIKTVLGLTHKQLPPSLHFQRANPALDLAGSPFYVNTALSDWEAAMGSTRRAGVSSFGMGGTNAHVILEEAPKPIAIGAFVPERPLHILTLSARSGEALSALVGRYVAHLEAHPGISLVDLCFTANTGRRHFEHRLAVVADTVSSLLARLREWLAGPPRATAAVPHKAQPPTASPFTGQDGQYVGMGRASLSEDGKVRLPNPRPDRDEWQQLLNTLGALYQQGVFIDWAAFDRDYVRRRVQLPTYPFQRQRHWIEPPGGYRPGAPPLWSGAEDEAEDGSGAEDESGASGSLAEALYQVLWRPAERRLPNDAVDSDAVRPGGLTSILLFSDTQGIGQHLAAQLRSRGAACIVVFPGNQYRQLDEQAFQIDPTTPGHFQQLLAQIPNVQGVVHLWSPDAPAPSAGVEALDRAAGLGCASALHLVQSLVENDAQLPHLWLVTRGAQWVDKGDAVPGLAQSGLWGLGKAIGLEYPEFDCILVDLDSESPAREQAGMLFHALFDKGMASDAVEDRIAFRQGTRYVARLVPRPPAPTPAPMAFRPDASYLITGGLGGLGLKTAHWMAAHGARHLVLAGRSGASPAVGDRLKALEGLGANVTVVKADIADADDVTRLLAEIQQSPAPLAGIVHGAGVVEYDGLWQQDWERFARVMAPKVRGSWLLHAGTKDLPLEFFVCFSSLASLLGSHGLGSYCAANAFLDALAHHRRGLGLPALSIDWGPWGEVGMGAGLDADHRARLTQWGIGTIAPDGGFSVLGQLLRGAQDGQSSARVGVIPMDWSRWLRQFPRRPAFYDHVAAPGADIDSRETSPQYDGFMEKWRNTPTPTPERRDALMNHIRAKMEQTLGTEGIAPGQNLMDLGLDSLMAVELRAWLKSELQCSPRATVLFDYPTIETLTDYLLQDVPTDREEIPDPPRSPDHGRQRCEDTEIYQDWTSRSALYSPVLALSRPAGHVPPLTVGDDSPALPSSRPGLPDTGIGDDKNEAQNGAHPPTLVPIRPQTDEHAGKLPLFCMAGVFGSVFDFIPLSRRLGPEQPLYGLRSLGLDEQMPPYTRMEDIAAHHIQALQTIQPQGPYGIAGYSFGGKVAFEMARQLIGKGHEVSLLAVIDIQLAIPEAERRVSQWDSLETILKFAGIYEGALGRNLGLSRETLCSLEEEARFAYLSERSIRAGQPSTALEAKRLVSVYRANLQAAEDYAPDNIPIPMTLLRAAEHQPGYDFLPDEAATAADPTWGWERVCSSVEVAVVPGDHFTMMAEPHVRVLAEGLTRRAASGKCEV
ncbi:MAG: Methyltransferase domain-containing protein [Candidatus Kentron sp. G]|nr:MAG: Methyltransferase domain-containing protein [Candidatus Kentron sp. G]